MEIVENSEYIIRNSYVGPTIVNNKYVIQVPKYYQDKAITLISNPVLILTTSNTVEYDANKILNKIELNIENSQIDCLHNNNQVYIYQKLYNLQTRVIGNKIFIPLPINCLLKKNGLFVQKCSSQDINIVVELSDYSTKLIFNSIEIRFDCLILTNNFNYDNIFTLVNSITHKNQLITHEANNKFYLEIKNIVFLGLESFCGATNHKFIIPLLYDPKRIIFCIESNDRERKIIQCFNNIKILADGHTIFESDYETLLFDTNISSGIFVINFENILSFHPKHFMIVFDGITEQNINLNWFVESKNYLLYSENKAELLFRAVRILNASFDNFN